jgi:hypothetical protein
LPSKSVFYGAMAILVAVVIVVSSVGALYFYRSQQEASAAQSYADELSQLQAKYNALAAGTDTSLADYNTTLSLLATVVANLNTSSPAYQYASRELPVLWREYENLTRLYLGKSAGFVADMRVDYGNGTRQWYNQSQVQPGWNLYTATVVLLDGRVQATWYPAYQEHFVEGINGVEDSQTESWFIWLKNSSGWQLAPSGPDLIFVTNGTVFAWTLCGFDANYSPTCSP